MTVKKNKIGQTRWAVKADVVDLVRNLARQLPDLSIAAILNRSGKRTGHGASWTRSHVCSLRNIHGISVYREGERAERGERTLDEAADILKVSRATAYRMVSSGVLPARQLCTGAPWIIQLYISRKCRASATFVRFVVIGTFCSPVSPSNTHQPALNPPIDKRKSSSWRVGAVGMVFADPWLQAAESSLHDAGS